MSGGFSFGSTPATGGGFSFGSKSSNDASSKPAAATFSFGGGGTAASATPAPAFGTTAAPAFGIGAPAFGTATIDPKTNTKSPPPLFSFGGSTTSTATATTSTFGNSSGIAVAAAPSSFGTAAATDSTNKSTVRFEDSQKPDDDKNSRSKKKTSFGGALEGTGGGATFGGSTTFGGDGKSGKPAFGGSFTFGANTATAPTPAPTFGASSFGAGGSAATFGAASAPVTGGFTFGATATTAAATATATTPDATTNDPKTPARIPATPTAPAPVATPHHPPTGATTTTATSGQTSTTPMAPAAPPATSNNLLEYKTLSVEQILNKFQKELERDVLIFKEQARVVSERDAILRDAQRDIQSLTTKLHRCSIQQEELEKTVSSIIAFQDEMERTLVDCESSVNELFRSQGNVAPVSSDYERENIFKSVEDVESRLQAVQEAFELASSQMNQGITANLDSDVAQIIKVVYQHQLALQEVELTSRRMEKEMDEVTKVLRRAEHHSN